MNRRIHLALVGVLGLAGAWQLGAGAWIHVKALLAQHLLARAWERSLQSGTPTPPWPWADTWPVARLHLVGLADPIMVLQGDSGRTLAFGPGQAPEGVQPGEPGTVLLSGHRDTHFSVLHRVRTGQSIRLETLRGEFHYRVEGVEVLDARRQRIRDTGQARLVLVTCHPFDAPLPGGPERLVISAVPVPGRPEGGGDRTPTTHGAPG